MLPFPSRAIQSLKNYILPLKITLKWIPAKAGSTYAEGTSLILLNNSAMKNLLILICLFAAIGCNSENKETNRQTAAKQEKAKLISMRSIKDNAKESLRKSDCSKSGKAAETAYKAASKAMNAESLDNIQDNSKAAMEAFGEARKYAAKCGCARTNEVANNGFMFSKNASQSGNLRDALNYAQEASKIAHVLLAVSDSCSYDD